MESVVVLLLGTLAITGLLATLGVVAILLATSNKQHVSIIPLKRYSAFLFRDIKDLEFLKLGIRADLLHRGQN